MQRVATEEPQLQASRKDTWLDPQDTTESQQLTDTDQVLGSTITHSIA